MNNGEYKAKIEIEASGAIDSANKTAKAVGGATSAVRSFNAILRGDFVSAISQGRVAFMSLRTAMVATPWGAVIAGIVAVSAAMIGAAWKRNAEEVAQLRKETEDYVQRLKELRGELDSLPQRTTKNIRKIEKSDDDETAARLAGEARAKAGTFEKAASEKDRQAAQFSANLGRGARQSDVEEAQKEAARLRVLAEEYRQTAGEYEEAVKRIQGKKGEAAAKSAEDAKRIADDAAKQAAAEQDRIAQAERNLQDAERRTNLERNMAGKDEKGRIEAQLEDAQARYNDAAQRQRAPGVSIEESLQAATEQENITAEMIRLRDALKTLEEAVEKSEDKAKKDKPEKPPKEEIRRPLEGLNDFIQSTAGDLGGARMAMVKGAMSFRDKLNPSAVQTLGREFGGKEPAGSKLEQLQAESRDYLKAIYETWKPWNLTGAGE